MSSDRLHGLIELTKKSAAVLRIPRSDYFSSYAKSVEKPVYLSVFYYRLPTDSSPEEKNPLDFDKSLGKRRLSDQISS
jgi:hypothetical protein